jgi:hypothetical protein
VGDFQSVRAVTSRLTRRAVGGLCLAIAVSASCSSSPTGPGGLNVSGAWVGSWQFVTSGVTVTDNVTVSFVQTAGTATGTWTADSGATGSMQFQVAGSVTGTVTISQATLSGLTCIGTGQLSGTVSSTAISITTSGFSTNGSCQWATNDQFSLHR